MGTFAVSLASIPVLDRRAAPRYLAAPYVDRFPAAIV